MSRLCRLKTKSHGADGQWAYEEITRLREALLEARTAMIDIDEFTVEPVCNIAKEAIAKIDEVLK